jgi:hypothetical protein
VFVFYLVVPVDVVLSLIYITEKAVVTLPDERCIQFINTTKNKKDNKINIGEWCGGVTAVKDKIYIGGFNQVIIFIVKCYILWSISTIMLT